MTTFGAFVFIFLISAIRFDYRNEWNCKCNA